MRESYLDKLEEEGASMPETIEEVVRMKMDLLENILAELEYLSSSEFNASPRKKQADAWREVRQNIRNISVNERELNSRLTKMFDHAYYNAMEHLYE